MAYFIEERGIYEVLEEFFCVFSLASAFICSKLDMISCFESNTIIKE